MLLARTDETAAAAGAVSVFVARYAVVARQSDIASNRQVAAR